MNKQPHRLCYRNSAARLEAFLQCGRLALACCALMCVAVVGRGQGNSPAGVTYERILNAPLEAENWLTYSGRYSGWRYSTLDRINIGNIARLRLEWAFQTADLGQLETTPLVVDGVLYGTGQNNRAFALDARTGRAIWRYQRNLPDKLQPCCGMVNRGFAMLGNRLFMATLDAHVVALDAKTGNVLWDTVAADYRKAYTFTVAPLVVKDKVIVGISGGEYGVRGFIDAYDAESGRRVWRFNTVPGPGEPAHETWTGRFLEDRRSPRLGYRLLRSRIESRLLADRESFSQRLWR